jgi:hypothetical protein
MSVRMRSQVLRALTVAVVLLVLPAAAFAQFGHPLKGQWSGEWGPPGNPTRLLLDLHWDGKAITGAINPGMPTEAKVTKVSVDYTDFEAWKVKIEAEGKDASGKPVQVRVDGVLDNIGAYRRQFHGTWTQGGQSAPFSVTRN